MQSTLDKAYEIFQFHSIFCCCPQELSPCSLSLVSNSNDCYRPAWTEQRARVMMHSSYLLVQIAYSALPHTHPDSHCFMRQLFLIQFKRVRSFPTLLYMYTLLLELLWPCTVIWLSRENFFSPKRRLGRISMNIYCSSLFFLLLMWNFYAREKVLELNNFFKRRVNELKMFYLMSEWKILNFEFKLPCKLQ